MTAKVEFKRGDIFAALTSLLTPGKFHWMIYVVEDPVSKQGWKVHATDAFSPGFEFQFISWSGPSSEEALLFVKIGYIEEGLDAESLVEYVKDIPTWEVPGPQKPSEPRLTCRVWFKEAIRILDGAGMFVQCPNVDALENELIQKAMAAVILQDGTSDFTYVASVAQSAHGWA